MCYLDSLIARRRAREKIGDFRRGGAWLRGSKIQPTADSRKEEDQLLPVPWGNRPRRKGGRKKKERFSPLFFFSPPGPELSSREQRSVGAIYSAGECFCIQAPALPRYCGCSRDKSVLESRSLHLRADDVHCRCTVDTGRFRSWNFSVCHFILSCRRIRPAKKMLLIVLRACWPLCWVRTDGDVKEKGSSLRLELGQEQEDSAVFDYERRRRRLVCTMVMLPFRSETRGVRVKYMQAL